MTKVPRLLGTFPEWNWSRSLFIKIFTLIEFARLLIFYNILFSFWGSLSNHFVRHSYSTSNDRLLTKFVRRVFSRTISRRLSSLVDSHSLNFWQNRVPVTLSTPTYQSIVDRTLSETLLYYFMVYKKKISQRLHSLHHKFVCYLIMKVLTSQEISCVKVCSFIFVWEWVCMVSLWSFVTFRYYFQNVGVFSLVVHKYLIVFNSTV